MEVKSSIKAVQEYLDKKEPQDSSLFQNYFLTMTPLDFRILLPRSSVILAGTPGSGKSTLAQNVVGEYVNKGWKVVVLDTEGAWVDPQFYGKLNGDLSMVSEEYPAQILRFVSKDVVKVSTISDDELEELPESKISGAIETLKKEILEEIKEFYESDKRVYLISPSTADFSLSIVLALMSLLRSKMQSLSDEEKKALPPVILIVDSVHNLRTLAELRANSLVPQEAGLRRARVLGDLSFNVSRLAKYGVISILVAQYRDSVQMPYTSKVDSGLGKISGGWGLKHAASSTLQLIGTGKSWSIPEIQEVKLISVKAKGRINPKFFESSNKKDFLSDIIPITTAGWSIIADLARREEISFKRRDTLRAAILEEIYNPDLRRALYWRAMSVWDLENVRAVDRMVFGSGEEGDS